MDERKRYPTDLTDRQWAVIAEWLPVQRTGRPRKYSQRELINAIVYALRTGCAWRLLPHDMPPWQSVYGYFRKLQAAGLWQRMNDRLREQVRQAAGREAEPSTIVVDSQSVKTTEKGGHGATMAANGSKGASANSR